MALPGDEENLIARLRRLFHQDNAQVGGFLWRVARCGRLKAGASPQLWPYMCLDPEGYTAQDLLRLLEGAPRGQEEGRLPAWTRGLFQLVQACKDQEALRALPEQVDPWLRGAVEWSLAEAGLLGAGQLSPQTLERSARSACVALLVPTHGPLVWGQEAWSQALRQAALEQREDVLLSNQLLPALLPALAPQEFLKVAPRINLKAWPQVVELLGERLGELTEGLQAAWEAEARPARDEFWAHLLAAAHHHAGQPLPEALWPRFKGSQLKPGADLAMVVRWGGAFSPEQRQDLITAALGHARVEVRREAVSWLEEQPHSPQVASWLEPRLGKERSDALKAQIQSLLERSHGGEQPA